MARGTAPLNGHTPAGAPAPAPAPARRLPSPAALHPLFERMRPHVASLVIGGIALFVSAGIGLAFPLIVRNLLDAAFIRSSSSALDRIALVLIALFAMQGVLNYTQVWLLTSAAERVVAKLEAAPPVHSATWTVSTTS